MEETIMPHSSFAEFITRDNSTEDREKKQQLIRILSRSSTLPKVGGIFIKPSSKPGFYINPGHAIHLGKNLLENPAAALLCLRYGFEWQIWYKNQDSHSIDSRICDLAACHATAKFYKLTPLRDGDIIKLIPHEIREVIEQFRNKKTSLNKWEEINFEKLKKFHRINYPKKAIASDKIKAIQQLASPLESLLMSGGDLRLNVDSERLLNVYECRPFPRPKAFTFASSTATSISNVAYNQSENQRQLLIKSALKSKIFHTATDFSKKIKSKLKKALSLPASTAMILAPSGTDISLQVAGICQSIYDKKIVHIIVASDETGSGVPLALQGQHFSGKTAHGNSVEKGELISGFKEAEVRNIKLRNKNGLLKSPDSVDREVYEAVRQCVKDHKQPVLHVMNQSKLGYNAPSDPCLKKLQHEFKEDLLVLIDNSQLRIDQADIREYVKRNCIMTITGSKFFTGPPFCGALIIPAALKEKWKNEPQEIPVGLNEYCYKHEWPEDWAMAEALTEGINLGISMRWHAAITEINRYFKIPLSLRYLGSDMFCNHVRQAIDNSCFLEHLPDYDDSLIRNSDPQRIKNRRTIFPFFVKYEDQVLSREELTRLYRLLNRNLAGWTETVNEEDKHIAQQACHIGQPVKATYKDGTPSGVVRISLGSRVISESWKDRDVSIFFKKIEAQMIQVDIIIRKIKLILNHPEWLRAED